MDSFLEIWMIFISKASCVKVEFWVLLSTLPVDNPDIKRTWFLKQIIVSNQLVQNVAKKSLQKCFTQNVQMKIDFNTMKTKLALPVTRIS